MAVGKIVWQDLTVQDAPAIRAFYEKVAGWTHTEVDMGGYSDFAMNTPDSEECVAGICHQKGVNTQIPPQWLVYIEVHDIEQSTKSCVELGGKVLDGPRVLGNQLFCVIQDPAGAVCALIESAKV